MAPHYPRLSTSTNNQVAFSLTPAKLKELWIIPLGFVLITGVSALVAWILSKVFRLKKSQT
jgi:predicted permease